MCLVHPGALGDLLQALPAFSAVRAAYPGAELSLVVGDDLVGAVATLGLFDAFDTFPAARAYHGSPADRVAVLARLGWRLRRRAPDRVGVFKAAPVYAALARVSGAPVRVGLARGVGARLLTTAIPVDPEAHHADRYLAVATALGAAGTPVAAPRWPAVTLPDAFARAARDAAVAGRLLVAVAPGGARNAKQDYAPKRWPPERFADVLRRTAQWHPLTVIVLGARSDRGEADALLAALDGVTTTADLVGATDLAQARAVIAGCAAYLGNDSGLMHLAGTTDTPIVAVFGPTDPRVLAPRGPHVRTVWHPARARPCVDEVDGRVTACAAVCCRDRVPVSEVVDALHDALAGAEAGRFGRPCERATPAATPEGAAAP